LENEKIQLSPALKNKVWELNPLNSSFSVNRQSVFLRHGTHEVKEDYSLLKLFDYYDETLHILISKLPPV